MQLPFADATFDVCYSSNVLEHVVDPWRMADEMVRVTRPGGVVFISYTVWYGPWGGHETAPWHFLGGRRARRRYRRRTATSRRTGSASRCSRSPSGPASAGQAARPSADVLDVIPRYNPRFAHWLVTGARCCGRW